MQRIEDIKEVQTILNALLVHFANVCEQHGLRYYLSNGTLLGAIKYGKFIPWDDDVDVMMPREDYDKLMQLDAINTCCYRLCSSQTCPTWRVPFAKLTDTRTVCYETTADFGCGLGVSMDIFPIDNWDSNMRRAEREAAKGGLLRRGMSASIENQFYSPRKGVKRAILYGIWCFSRMCGYRFFLKRIVRLTQKHAHESTKYCGCVAWAAYGKREVIEAEAFATEKKVVFEGREHTVFGGYDAYLRRMYGDYEKDPPADKQKTHHTFEVFRKTDDENQHDSCC